MSKNTLWKVLIIVGVLAYTISPIDLLPGLPIDDILMIILGTLGEVKLFKDSKKDDEKDIVDSKIVE